jgi:hypothetical protein
MPTLLAGTIEFVHIEQVSALFKFRLGQFYCQSLKILRKPVAFTSDSTEIRTGYVQNVKLWNLFEDMYTYIIK